MTETVPLVIDPILLSTRLAKLLAAKKTRHLEPDQAAALAECCFRLALSEDRPLDAQVQLLRDAVKIDGTHPKFAYHLARLYLLAGEFDAASQWLKTAVALCPTSHRLWTHVSLLQRNLNARYFGNETYEPNALRELAEQIEVKIAEGADHFESNLLRFQPPISRAVLEDRARKQRTNGAAMKPDPTPTEEEGNVPPVRRITRTKTCRWSGIHDLRIESQLQAAPTRQRLARLLPALTECAATSHSRQGGPAALSILGVLWIVSGYPVASVRRIVAEQCPDWIGPSRQLLDAVCTLAETPRSELPACLAAALRDRQVPPLVVAMLHKNRLLTPLPEFRNIAVVRAARRLLADQRPDHVRDSEATELAQKLLNTLESFLAPPPGELADIVPEPDALQRSAAELQAEFESLEVVAVNLDSAKEKAFEFIKTDLVLRIPNAKEPDAAARVRADRATLEETIAALRHASAEGLTRIEVLVHELAAHTGAAPQNLYARREDCYKKFTALSQLGNFTRILQRHDGQINALPSDPAITCTPALGQVLTTIRSAFASQKQELSQKPTYRSQMQADELSALLDRDWIRVKQLVAIHSKNDPPLSADECAEITAIHQRVNEIFARATSLIEALTSARANAEVLAENLGAFEDTMKMLMGVGERKGAFVRNLRALPSEEPTVMKAENVDCSSPQEVRTGLVGMVRVLDYAEREVARIFAMMESTFAPYSETEFNFQGLRDLRFSLLARQAMIWYRFGRRDQARRIWSQLHSEDRLDAGILRNLAVCDTLCGRSVSALSAWRSLIELIYFYDIVADDLRPHADARRGLHRGLSHGYAPAILQLKPDEWGTWQEKGDTVDVIAFLSSPSAVRNFVGHKLLEFFNARLQVTSPPVLLGVSRADSAEMRKRAYEQWQSFQTEMVEMLPSRIRRGIDGILQRRFSQAFEICQQPQRLTPRRDPTYPDDHRCLLNLVVDYSSIRVRVAFMLIRAQDKAGQLGSFAGLLELLKLDHAPCDSSHEFFDIAAGKLRLSPDDLKTILIDFAQQMVLGALQFVLDEPIDDVDALRRQLLFGKMVEQIVPHERLQNVVALIDGPHHSVNLTAKWLPNQHPEVHLSTLRRWRRSFPAMAGVSFLLAQKLLESSYGASPEQNRDITSEVIEVLESGCRQGFYEPSIVICAQQLAAIFKEQGQGQAALDVVAKYRDQANNDKSRVVLSRMHSHLQFQDAIDKEQFDEAIRVGLDLLANTNHEEKVARNLLKVFEKAAQRNRTDPGSARLHEAITSWADRAEARWNQYADNLDEEAVSLETIQQIRTMLEETLVQIVMHQQTNAEGNWDPAELALALSDLLFEHPNLVSAYYHRMRAWHAVAEDSNDPAEKASALSKTHADANEVLDRSRDPKQKQDARSILNSDTD